MQSVRGFDDSSDQSPAFLSAGGVRSETGPMREGCDASKGPSEEAGFAAASLHRFNEIMLAVLLLCVLL